MESDSPLDPLDLKAIDTTWRFDLKVVDAASFGVGHAKANQSALSELPENDARA
jgi:hypothetical protein